MYQSVLGTLSEREAFFYLLKNISMKVAKVYNLALTSLIALSVFLIAFSVDARERGDREHPDRPDRTEQPQPMPPEEEETPDDGDGPIVIPQELLERWEELLREGKVEQVEQEYRDYVENGIYPTDPVEEENDTGNSNEDGEDGEDGQDGNDSGGGDSNDGGDDPTECRDEVIEDRNDRIRDRQINRNRGETPAPLPACEEDEEESGEEGNEEEENDDNGGFEATYEEKFVQRIHQLVNQVRLEEGLGILIHDGMLEYLATTHSEWMMDTKIFSHDRIDPSTGSGQENCDFGCRLAEVEYPVTAWGENIAWRSGDLPSAEELAESVMQGWMNSASHRANILDPDFEIMGIGIVREGSLVFTTQDFATK